jgi:general secretion pathway protein D
MPDLSRQNPPHLGLTSPIVPATWRRVLRPSKLLLSTLLTAVTALAQNPAPPAPAPATPGTPPAVPTPGAPGAGNPRNNTPSLDGRVPTNAPGKPIPAPEGDVAPLFFPDADVREVLAYYEKLTGKTLLIPPAVNASGATIYISVRQQIDAKMRQKIIEMTLGLSGIYLIPTEDENILKVSGGGMSPKGVAPVPFIDDEEKLPADEQVVMFLLKLRYQDATELAQTLANGVVVPGGNGAQVTQIIPLPKTNSLLITESTPMIRTLLRVVRAIDDKPIEALSRFFVLTNAQAEDVVTNLNTLFEQPTTQPGGTPVPAGANAGANRGRNPNTPNGGRSLAVDNQGNPIPNTGGIQPEMPFVPTDSSGTMAIGTEDNIIVGKVKLTADKRTNRVHVVARKRNMDIIKALIEEYDANVALPAPFVRHIRYRPVEEMMEAVVQSILDPGDKAGANGAGGTNALGQRTNPNQAAGANTGANRFGAGNTGGTAGGSSSTGGDTGGLAEGLEVSSLDPTPISQQVGKSTIIADRRNQTLIVVGTKDVKDKVSALVDRMDVRQPQVMIHTIVGELRLGSSYSFGIDYILRNGGILTGATTTPTTPTDPTTPAATTTTNPVGFVNGGGTFLNANDLLSQQSITKVLAGGTSGLSGVVLTGNALDVAVNALESTDRFRVVTRPSIFTLNAKRAIITSGEEVPVPTSTLSNGGVSTNGGLSQNTTISYKPIELRLEVMPLINNDKEVTLEVVQNISERAGSTTIDNNVIPNISRRALKTNVIVPNNGTLILGGLVKESKDFTKGGIPLLNRIPYLGALFGKTSKDKLRTELIVMMRPVVTFAPGETSKMREREVQDYNMPPDLEASLMPTGIWGEAPVAKVVAPVKAVRVKNEVFNAPRR